MSFGFHARGCVRWLVVVFVLRDVKFTILDLVIMINTVTQNTRDDVNGMSSDGMVTLILKTLQIVMIMTLMMITITRMRMIIMTIFIIVWVIII